ncbi:TPA: hypothetical protein DEP34_02615 [Candidatus Uhrbacteria bacterium]|uniref:Uncharacterized protein n=2 Tax=Candidatus Uhriibacteriota TaxID=1752732 RepID=A0A0G1SE75_9BACT|nr:MAG: hypothetical protein UX45_C0018G0015 [Candidatus Uhrbacteria bacterium GW2011_GWF2_46_218]KKU40423.1 MAG: hypothetical protein UX57_C0017G0015 [Candidatus Uhrbacteria bacterium GW2011_GWE2_46_68]HBK33883.1 hypothetical protein [Candidatus Uhrbacteria bacterium]HCB19254.1 hypothetical protein [Candidatus Uhrbacteria bacterium]
MNLQKAVGVIVSIIVIAAILMVVPSSIVSILYGLVIGFIAHMLFHKDLVPYSSEDERRRSEKIVFKSQGILFRFICRDLEDKDTH